MHRGPLRHSEHYDERPHPRFDWPRFDPRPPHPRLSNSLAIVRCKHLVYPACTASAGNRRAAGGWIAFYDEGRSGVPARSVPRAPPDILLGPSPLVRLRSAARMLPVSWAWGPCGTSLRRTGTLGLLCQSLPSGNFGTSTCLVFSRLIHASNTMRPGSR